MSDVQKTTCTECDGKGKVRPFEFQGETVDGCPWCDGTGQVDVLYDVRTHGHNGDFPFSELADVVTSLDQARKLATRIMTKDRFHNLHNGAPTVKWVEIMGPGIEESLGLEDHEGQLVWTGEETMTDEARDLFVATAPADRSHTQAFREHQARREAERAAELKVTWRKVSPDTGGGWSGLGPNGQLVFVAKRDALGGAVYDYGDVHQTTRPWRRSTVGTKSTLAKAKAAAAELFTHDAPQGAEGGTTMEATATITADDLAGDGIEAVRAGKAPYARMRANGKTLAYADDRKSGVVLSISAKALEGIAAGKKKSVVAKGGRGVMSVTSKNVKGARALLEALAKQVA